ncbi:hypothetical protein NLI96_g11476 [Meripilus lineatus]|uniref:Uncharacterized protein n=1 Tax=Meripilus lineatus TaxID=2056292 RepID=A0AAD5URV6_9APHY|nr:hypothetical protein NLI96_g11476 [Physisporinus lineatus]
MEGIPQGHDIAIVAQHIIDGARGFLQAFQGAHILPEIFLRIPGKLQQINWLAEVLVHLGNNGEPEFVLYLLEETRLLWDQLLEVENIRIEHLPPLQDILEREKGLHGEPGYSCYRTLLLGLSIIVGSQTLRYHSLQAALFEH